jgi:hypothetical protein
MNNPYNGYVPQGLQAYKGYLFSISGNLINVKFLIDLQNGGLFLTFLTNGNWTSNWNSLSTTISHKILQSQNDSRMYICNGSNVAVVYEPKGSLTSNIVALPSFNIATTHTNDTGTTTTGSPNISTTSNFFQQTDVGAVITGDDIPTGATIIYRTDSKHAILSLNANGNNVDNANFLITAANTFVSKILPIPINDQTTCLTELGNNLLVGGINNYIYPWDRISPNFLQPIFLSENYVYEMITVNTNTFAFVGERGRIYITNGSQAQVWKKIPDHISGTVNPFFNWKSATFNRNQLYCGFSVTDNLGNTINQYGGLWAIDIDTKAIRLLNQLSYGTYAGYASALTFNKGNLLTETQTSLGYGLFIGWSDGTLGGIDKGVSTPYINSQSIIVSDLIPIGTFDLPKDFERLEYKLSKPMVSGESISVYARLIFDTEDTGFGTAILTDNTVGNFSSSNPINFKNAQWLQLKAIINSTETNPSYTRLTQLRIR